MSTETDGWTLAFKKLTLEVTKAIKHWLGSEDPEAKEFRAEIANNVLKQLKEQQNKPDIRVS